MIEKNEMIFGVRAVIEAIQAGKENEKELVNSLSRLDGILSVSLLSHDGEVKQ